jgi:membrane protein
MTDSGRTPTRRGVWQMIKAVRKEMTDDNLTLVAAGVAFYAMLALFPAIIAVVTVYALVTDAQQVREQVTPLLTGLPQDARGLLLRQLESVVEANAGGLTVGLVASLLGTVWAASGGMQALMTGLNVINDTKEDRGFVKRRALALGLTLGALVSAVLVLALVAAFPIVLDWIGLGGLAAFGVQVVRWSLLVMLVATGLAVLYRYGPAHPDGGRWRWISWGTASAVAVWVVASAGFSLYVSAFGKASYNKTYGSLAAVIVLLLWLYLSAFAILLGAQVDSVRAKLATGDGRFAVGPAGSRKEKQSEGV